jgi:hypothetical protein
MYPRTLWFAVALAAVATDVSGQSAQRRSSFEGTWSSATTTPLERPRGLADKPFFTPQEAEDWARQVAENNEDPPPGSRPRGIGTFNAVYREIGGGTVRTLRTSIVTDPPDGRLPPLTEAAAAARQERIERNRTNENPEDLSLQDRCMTFSTVGPPLLPYSYNSNVQIIQTESAVVVHTEMIHDARIIHMDGRRRPPEDIRLWTGYSVGRWEGDTLVVETTNFNEGGGGFYGSAGGNFGWDANRRVIERFSLFDDETLLYRFEIDNPTAFTRPWKGELTLERFDDNIYEYACHEGNYAMEGILRGARATEGSGR